MAAEGKEWEIMGVCETDSPNCASDFKNKSCEMSGEFSIVFFLPGLMVKVTWVQGEMQRWQQLPGCGEPCCRARQCCPAAPFYSP